MQNCTQGLDHPLSNLEKKGKIAPINPTLFNRSGKQFSDGDIPSKLIKTGSIDQGIPPGTDILKKIDPTNLFAEWNGAAKVWIPAINRSLQAVQLNRGVTREVNIAEADSGGFHNQAGQRLTQLKPIHI